MPNLLIASTSTVYGSGYLEYLYEPLFQFFKGIQEILFIPYARPGGISFDDYTEVAQRGFDKSGKTILGIHTFKDPQNALQNAKAVFVGGGNTFLLVKTLYDLNLMEALQNTIQKGAPYLGTSAGSNLLGLTMQTTNDMPIVYPPSFKTLGAIPFNINPHYLDPDQNSKHKGETRETRIREFHSLNEIPVIGLREGSWLLAEGDEIVLKGSLSARLFQKDKEPIELLPGTDLSKI